MRPRRRASGYGSLATKGRGRDDTHAAISALPTEPRVEALARNAGDMLKSGTDTSGETGKDTPWTPTFA